MFVHHLGCLAQFLLISRFNLRRAPTVITCVNSPYDEVKINLILPELKNEKGGETIHHCKEMENLTPKECQEAIKDFHHVILQEKGKGAIVTVEIQLTVKSSYVPTMKLLDIPGLAHGDKISKKILKKYFKKYQEKIHPLICVWIPLWLFVSNKRNCKWECSRVA